MHQKSKKGNLVNTINDIVTIGRSKGLGHLITDDSSYNGRIITIKGKKTINFGSCSYLGLELDKRLKEGAIDAINRYGVQFSSSRSYMSFTLYREFEELAAQIFGAPTVLSPSTSMGHQAVMPIVIGDNDAVIIDQQAHFSMQDPAQKLQLRGIPLFKIRHNKLDELKKKIQELAPKYEKIWYIIDGVYSMYGDMAPIKELIRMMARHNKLHLYVDDAHSMSWIGTNGNGSVLDTTGLHPKMVFATSLNKSFAGGGGAFVLPSEELYWKVKQCGGPLIHSGPLQVGSVGASIASAKIHLTDEIYDLQEDLVEKVLYCNQVLQNYNLPVIGDSISPVFFIGLGLTKVGYNMVKRLVDDGLWVNLGIFPAVPQTCTGIRFTITRHHTNEDIERLGERIAYHLPRALQEEERTMRDIYRAFRHVKDFDLEEQQMTGAAPVSHGGLTIQHETSVQDIPQQLWDDLLGDKCGSDRGTLLLLEECFTNNELPEDNWEFNYYVVRDKYNTPIAATFFTTSVLKDDMLAPGAVSEVIEQQRHNDPYYLTSKTMMMGSLLSEGEHLFIDRSNPEWKSALMLILDSVWQEQDQREIQNLLFRDFGSDDNELKVFFMDQGFIKIDTPGLNIVGGRKDPDLKDYFNLLDLEERECLLDQVCDYELKEIKDVSESDIDSWYRLYQDFQSINFEINCFDIPKKFFESVVSSPDWEYLQFFKNNSPAAFVLVHKKNVYKPLIFGINFEALQDAVLYKQLLFQLTLRGLDLGFSAVSLGITGDLEKQKLGASTTRQAAFMQMKDDYNMSLISMIPTTKKESTLT